MLGNTNAPLRNIWSISQGVHLCIYVLHLAIVNNEGTRQNCKSQFSTFATFVLTFAETSFFFTSLQIYEPYIQFCREFNFFLSLKKVICNFFSFGIVLLKDEKSGLDLEFGMNVEDDGGQ